MRKNNKGFTLIELLVVIAIIGLLSTLAVISLNNARAKSRDSKRVADVKQMQTALEMYYNECNSYPAQGVAAPLPTNLSNGCTGASVATFIKTVPTAPLPVDGGALCTPAQNTYNYMSTNDDGSACAAPGPCPSYSITYCLGAATGGLAAGAHLAGPPGM